MSDTAAAPVGQADDPATIHPQAALEQLRELFSTMVPPDKLHLTDALGNDYTARAVLPARAQIVVMQQLAKLWEQDVPAATGDAAGVAQLLVGLAADESVLDGISEAFQAAHPAVVKQAQAAAEKAGVEAAHPADLFPVEELVAGLVPFFVRFAARAADLMGQLMGPKAAG